MKLNAMYFIVGFCLIYLFVAATNPQPITIHQPAQPKAVFTQSFRTMFGLENDIKSFIDAKVKEGYIVKSVSMMDDETWSKGIVVMEKY